MPNRYIDRDALIKRLVELAKLRRKDVEQKAAAKAAKKAEKAARKPNLDASGSWLERNIKRRYGLSMDDYGAMISSQDCRCAICSRMMQKAFVDHDHATGKVRQLLCRYCNSLLGMCNEDITVLMNAIKYLEKHKPSS